MVRYKIKADRVLQGCESRLLHASSSASLLDEDVSSLHREKEDGTSGAAAQELKADDAQSGLSERSA